MRILYKVPAVPRKRCTVWITGRGWYNRRPRKRKDSA